MAEYYLNYFGKNRFLAESAGVEAAEKVHPLVVELMREEGVDLSARKPRSVKELYLQDKNWDYYISVCQVDIEKACPHDTRNDRKYNWPFTDPASLQGSHQEQLQQGRIIRENIKNKILAFIREHSA